MSVDCLYSLIESFESAGLEEAEAISAATNLWHESKEYAEDGRPPKKWWDACVKRVKSGNPNYTEEQIRKTCGAIWHKRGVRKVMGKSEADKDVSGCVKRKIPIIVREWKAKGKAVNMKQVTAIAFSMCRRGTA